jgi:hypothetical protein
MECCVGLDDVLHESHIAISARRQRSAQGADHAGRHGAGEPQGVPDRYDELTNAKVVGVAQGGRLEVAENHS